MEMEEEGGGRQSSGSWWRVDTEGKTCVQFQIQVHGGEVVVARYSVVVVRGWGSEDLW